MTQSFGMTKPTGTSSLVADVTPYSTSAKYFAAGLFTLASLGITGIAYAEQPPQGGWTSISTTITTPSSLVVPSAGSLADRVEGLKTRTGLSWTQFSSLFGVTRRAVHFWARGGNMTDEHVARLGALQQSLSGVVRLDSRAARRGTSQPRWLGSVLVRSVGRAGPEPSPSRSDGSRFACSAAREFLHHYARHGYRARAA